MAEDEVERIAIESDADVVTARQRARSLAIGLDMPSTDQTLLATAISEIALTLVTIGVDLSKMNAVGDLQGGIEEAERLLGYEVSRSAEPVAEMR